MTNKSNHPRSASDPAWTRALLPLATAGMVLSLGGCGGMLRAWNDNSGNLVAAAPLCEDAPGSMVGANGTCQAYQPSDDMREYLGRVINESMANCGKFVNGLVLASTTTNTGLDVLTTVFTGLGSAFTPLGTVHALTAAGAISSGSKTAIDSDIYAKASLANYAQAIKTGYYTDMANYMTDLDKSDISKLRESLEVAKIRSRHAECSLASAQAAIAATISPPSGATPPPAGAPPAAPPGQTNSLLNLTLPADDVHTSMTVPGRALR